MERIRDQRCIVKCEFSRSELVGILSETSTWKQCAGKHSGLRITVRNNSIHKGMWRRSFYASSFSQYELQNQTWRGWRFWAIDSIVPRTHGFSSKPTLQSFCKNSCRNIFWTSHWSSDRENSWSIWTWNCNSITWWKRTDILCYDFQRKESVRGWSSYSQCRTQIKCRITLWTSDIWRRRTSLGTVEEKHRANWCSPFLKSNWQQGNLCGHPQHYSQPSVFVQTKNHSYYQQELESCSCQFFVWRSSVNSGLQNGYTNGASLRSRWTTIWRSTSLGHDKAGTAESVRKTWSMRFLMKEAARQDSSTVRILNIPWLTSRAIQGHSGGVPTDPELTGYIWFFTIWKEYIFHRGCLNDPVPAERIYKVISQSGDRILFERLSTSPRPAPKSHTEKQLASSSSLFVMMCRLAQGNLCTTGLGKGMSEATRRMIRPPQGNLCRHVRAMSRWLSSSLESGFHSYSFAFSGSFASRQWQLPWTRREVYRQHLTARAHTFLSAHFTRDHTCGSRHFAFLKSHLVICYVFVGGSFDSVSSYFLFTYYITDWNQTKLLCYFPRSDPKHTFRLECARQMSASRGKKLHHGFFARRSLAHDIWWPLSVEDFSWRLAQQCDETSTWRISSSLLVSHCEALGAAVVLEKVATFSDSDRGCFWRLQNEPKDSTASFPSLLRDPLSERQRVTWWCTPWRVRWLAIAGSPGRQYWERDCLHCRPRWLPTVFFFLEAFLPIR